MYASQAAKSVSVVTPPGINEAVLRLYCVHNFDNHDGKYHDDIGVTNNLYYTIHSIIIVYISWLALTVFNSMINIVTIRVYHSY